MFFKLRKAYFFDDLGNYAGSTGFKKSDKLIKYKEGDYNVNLKASSISINRWLLFKYEIYFYNLNNPDPKLLNGKEPIFDSEVYAAIIENEHMKTLNKLNKPKLPFELSIKNIAIGVIILVILIAVLRGQIHL